MLDYIHDRFGQILFASWQHASLVVQCLVLAVVIALVLAVLSYRNGALTSLANGVTAIALTLPSFAVIGLLIVPFGFGVTPSVILVTFFAVLPILRNAVVGLSGVDKTVVEAARGIGMSRMHTLFRIELPLAWPVILVGIRVSGQMVMGIATVAAYALGPGLGGLLFSGLARLGGANALNSIIVGVVGVVILAVILDLLLVALGRATTPRGIRV